MSTPSLLWRYATKAFDPSKKLTADDIERLKDSLYYSPSSYGLQPWHFVIVSDDELKARLRPHSWDQEQITSCSHLFVLCRKRSMDEAYINAFADKIVEARDVDPESIEGYRKMMVGGVMGKAEPKRDAWMAEQVYIALGFLMHTCMDMHIDCCPMEGFAAEEYDRILGLEEKGLTATVLCSVGYRSQDDAYANLAKVRWDKGDVFSEF